MSESWKPGDRFVFRGLRFTVVGPLVGDPDGVWHEVMTSSGRDPAGFLLVRSESTGRATPAALSVLGDLQRVERLPK